MLLHGVSVTGCFLGLLLLSISMRVLKNVFNGPTTKKLPLFGRVGWCSIVFLLVFIINVIIYVRQGVKARL